MKAFRSNAQPAQSGKRDSMEQSRERGENGERKSEASQRPSTVQSQAQMLRPSYDAGASITPTSTNESSSDVKDGGLHRRGTDGGLAGGGKGDNSKSGGRKGVSFLSRILAQGKSKNKADSVNGDDGGEPLDWRPEGMDAQVFSHSTTNVGFNPRHPPPPGYIKVRARSKKQRDFDRLFLAQELKRGKGKITPSADPTRSGPGAVRDQTVDAGNGEEAPDDAVWALEFSKDGKYLAAAGRDKVVRVWAVLSSREERRMHEKDEEQADGGADATDSSERLSAPVFRRSPFKEFSGHTSTVIDLSWSKNNFLLSSSFDKTVRLWHVSRQECLVTFKHAEYCPSIKFHPRDDRFFLAGSLDTKLRLWSIPDKSVAYWNQLPEMITAVAFAPDGKTAIAGTIGGTCMFYDTDGLKHKTQINVKASGRNAKPAKITGIQVINWRDDPMAAVGSGSSKGSAAQQQAAQFSPSNSIRREVKLLISSNDSRVRLYNFRDKNLEMKFKGHKNDASQIRASFSDDARFVISGSEDCSTYIWGTGPAQDGEKQRPMELFEAHSSMTTGAVLAPLKTRKALSGSEDPLYDLCNPPPVTLVSRSDSIRTGSNGSAHAANAPDSPDPGAANSVQPVSTAATEGFKRAEETPAYQARTSHLGGHIVVTADFEGNIKVFRQDCAHAQRRNSAMDSASLFSRNSRRRAGSIGGGGGSGGGRLGRSATQLSKGSATASISSSRSRTGSVATQPAGERILSWRQNVPGSSNSPAAVSTGSLDSGMLARRSKTVKSGSGRDRSTSPRRSIGGVSGAAAAAGRSTLRHMLPIGPKKTAVNDLVHAQTAAAGVSSTPDLRVTAASPTSFDDEPRAQSSADFSRALTTQSDTAAVGAANTAGIPRTDSTLTQAGSPLAANVPMTASPPPMDGDEEAHLRHERERLTEEANPLWLHGGNSYIFWSSATHRPTSSHHRSDVQHGGGAETHAGSSGLAPTTPGGSLRPPQTPGTELAPAITAVSRLSSEGSSTASDDEGAAEGELKCGHCGSLSFKAKRTSAGGHQHQLVCRRCGTPAS